MKTQNFLQTLAGSLTVLYRPANKIIIQTQSVGIKLLVSRHKLNQANKIRYHSFVSGLVLILSFILTNNVFPQGAGNWEMNQAAFKSKSNYDYERSGNEYDYRQSVSQTSTPWGYYYKSTNDTVITLETNVLMNVKADSYLAIFGVTQVGESIEQCHNLINTRIQSFIDNISKLGIKQEDIYIDFISQVPIFEYELEKKLFSEKSYNEIPKGFEVKKNIHIKYTDYTIAEKLLIEAAKSEIYDIVKVDYVINNIFTVYDSLRNVSINLMNKKVQEFKKLGVKFEPIYHTVSENITSSYPIEKYSYYTAFNVTSKSFKGVTVTKPIETHAPSLYYNKIPYNNYDFVINPVIIQPAVQFSFKLTMSYVLKKQQ